MIKSIKVATHTEKVIPPGLLLCLCVIVRTNVWPHGDVVRVNNVTNHQLKVSAKVRWETSLSIHNVNTFTLETSPYKHTAWTLMEVSEDIRHYCRSLISHSSLEEQQWRVCVWHHHQTRKLCRNAQWVAKTYFFGIGSPYIHPTRGKQTQFGYIQLL